MGRRIIVPRGFRRFPRIDRRVNQAEIQSMYEDGCAGTFYQPEETDRFNDRANQMYGTIDGEDIAHSERFADSSAGKLVIPFQYALKYFPNCLPGPGQERGDCVSHDKKNACLLTVACDIASGLPDQLTGVIEGVPELPTRGISEGVISSDFFYWYRGYDGDGWSCHAATNVAVDKGMLLRKPYPELGVDLTEYSGRMAGKYGRRRPPEEITAEGRKHRMRGAIRVRAGEAMRDFLGVGHGISSCGGESFENVRDENGVSRRTRKGWAHAMGVMGCDDRPIIHDIYGEMLFLIQNSWAIWNRGPRKILGTNILIPHGSFWARWSDIKNRTFLAHSSAEGWKSKPLPPIVLPWG